MDPSKGNTPNTFEVRVQGRYEQRYLIAKAESPTVALPPNPKLPIHEQCGMEEPTRDPHLDVGVRVGAALRRKAALDGCKAEVGRKTECGHGGRIEADLLLSAAKLAGTAAAPREDLHDRRWRTGFPIGVAPQERSGGGNALGSGGQVAERAEGGDGAE